MWQVANLSKLVKCCKCSSWNLLGLWRFSIPAALRWKLGAGEQHFLKGSNNKSWRSFSGNACTTVALRHMVAVGIPERPPLSRSSLDYLNPARVEEYRPMLCTGRICSAYPLYVVSKSMKSNKDSQLQFHLWGAFQTISRLWETVCRGKPQHSHLLFVNDPFCQDLVLELRSKKQGRLINIRITNPTRVEVDWLMFWTGRFCLHAVISSFQMLGIHLR